MQIALGTVTNVEEAVKWLSYTYLYVRMRANPLAYGINHKAYQVGDPECDLFHSACLSVRHNRTFRDFELIDGIFKIIIQKPNAFT